MGAPPFEKRTMTTLRDPAKSTLNSFSRAKDSILAILRTLCTRKIAYFRVCGARFARAANLEVIQTASYICDLLNFKLSGE
jgi:hypothetical protein